MSAPALPIGPRAPAPPAPADPSRRAMRRFTGLLLFVAAVGLLLLAGAAGRRRTPGTLPAPRTLSGMTVLDEAGRPRPLTPPGGGAVMIMSASCGHCHATLERLARAGGARLPRLHVIALEGAAAGRRTLDSLGIAAPVAGPRGPRTELIRRLGLTGTPLTLRVDADGNVEASVAGEFSEAEASKWAETLTLPRTPDGATPADRG